MHSGELIYDADCAFCTRFAGWVGAAVSWQALGVDEPSAAGWSVGGRVTLSGAPAIAEALVQRGGGWSLVGRGIRLPVLRVLADLTYRGVARHRHLMPGGTAACRVRTPGPSRGVMAAIMAAILAAGLLSLAAANRGSEAYPSLLMPGFGNVPESHGSVQSTEVVYTLVMADGTTRHVGADQLLADHSGYVAALRTLSDADAARDPETAAWLRSNLAAAGAVALTAEWHRVTYDTHTRERRDAGVQRSVTFDLEATR